MKAKTLFCDESGFDGNNLWQPDQPYFVYSAVDLSPDEADLIVKEARARFSIITNEIHAVKMLRTPKWRPAIEWILQQIHGKYQLACFHKRFSLACKFFEYMIEPTVSDGSNYFYHHGFHKFVANGLYFAAMAAPLDNEHYLTEFQSLIRGRDVNRLTEVIEGFAARSEGQESFLQSIATLLICNQPAIRSELETFQTVGEEQTAATWILELTTTALRSLCASASGSAMHPLIVTCDDSKPLRAGGDFVNAMVGRMDCASVDMDGRESQLTFNLAEGVRFADSRSSCGVQLADVAASAATFAFKKPDDSFSIQWREQHWDAVHEQSVFPDVDEFDLSHARCVKNTFILHALVDRSIQKIPLHINLRHLDAFVSHATEEYMLTQVNSQQP